MADTVNGEILQLARESRGLTQKKLSQMTHISQGRISKFERGDVLIPSKDLAKIARVLDYPKDFFNQQARLRGFGVSGIFHRRRQSISMLKLKKIQAEFNIRTLEIEKLLNGADIKSENEFHRLDVEDFNGDIEHIAELVRAQWNLPLGPVNSIVSVIESAGGIVLKYDLGSKKIDAQSRWISGLPPIFFANKNTPTDRLRFTLAHEIGHVIMHRIPTNDIEKQADRFASYFLMPKHEIIPDLKPFSLERAMSLKLKWKVSIAALIMRAFDLGIITESQKRRFFTRMGVAGYRTSEPITIKDDEKPTTIRQIVKTYQQEYNYTTSDLCKMLSISETDFRVRYLKAPPLRIYKF